MEGHQREETHVCSFCGKHYLTQSSLEIHIQTHLEEQMYKCAHCGLGFSNYNALEDHMNTHRDGLDLSRDGIQSNLQTATDSLYNISGEKVLYRCVLCSKEYYDSTGHVNIHGPAYSGDQTHLCVDCRARGQQHFSTMDPSAHVVTLQNVAPLTTPSPTSVPPQIHVPSPLLAPLSPPSKGRSAQKTLQVNVPPPNHMETRSQIQVDREHSFTEANVEEKMSSTAPSRPCRFCGKTFHPSYLKIHESLHSGDRPYPCNVCDKRFKAKQTLERHLFFHTNQRPFQCHLCKSAFKVKYQLNIHLRLHAKGRLVKVTKDKLLGSHKKRLPGSKCPDCGKRFATGTEFQDHITECSEKRPFMCSECGRKFLNQTNLYNHRKIHTELKAHQCVQCGKFFRQINALKRHRILHTTDKPYWCVICTVAEYQTYKALQRHMVACRKEKETASAE